MIMIGEKLNSSIPSAKDAFESKDNDRLLNLILTQVQNGAEYIDINTAMLEIGELDMMTKTINLVIENTSKGIMIDTVDMRVAREALSFIDNRPTIINSISMTTDISPLKGLDLSQIGVVAMPTDDCCIPNTPSARLELAQSIIDRLTTLGFREERIYIDILVETTAVNQQSALIAIDTLKLIKSNLPNIKTICGASNISFGLPMRRYINCAFISMLMLNGLDAAILDVNNNEILATVYASRVLLGQDEYCMDYLEYSRKE